MAVLEQGNLRVNVVDGVHHEVGLLAVLGPRREQLRGDVLLKLLVLELEAGPRGDGDEAAVETLDLGDADVRESGDGVAVEGAEGDLVEVDEADLGDAGAGEGGGAVGADAADTDDDDEGGAQPAEAVVLEEDAVAGELFQDQFFVKVTGLGATGQGLVAGILFVNRGRGAAV